MNARDGAAALRRLAAVPARIAGDVASVINDLIQDGFDRGTNPYGRAWARLRPTTLAKGRFPPPLTDTGAMRGGTRAVPRGGAGIDLEAPPPANFHQHGTVYMIARAVLPTGTLPPDWQAAAQRAYSEAFGKAWRS